MGKNDIHSKWVIITDGTNIFDSEIRAGAVELAHERGFHNMQMRNDDLIMDKSYLGKGLFKSGDAGIICHAVDVNALRFAAKSGIPIVLLGEESAPEWRKAAGGAVAVCSVDNEDIGRLAADYLYGQRRFRSYVFADNSRDEHWDWWSMRRYKAFSDTLAEHGHIGEVRRVPVYLPLSTPDEDAKRFFEAITDLPRPIAVFACNDIVAKSVVGFLDMDSVRMPLEAAVLGVDDDRELCETAAVKISSIRIEHRRLGRTAMTLMLRMLQGGSHHDKTILCPALRVVERESTRRLAPSNPRVSAALDFIRTANVRELSVNSVTKAANASHTYLATNFKKETGLTILDAIHERVVDETKRLLTDTDIPISIITEEMGFKSASGLYELFKKKTGSTMSEFRKNRPLL